MAKKSNNRRRKNSSVASLVGFEAAPLLEGEDADAFNALLTRLCDSVKPTDVIEEMWVQDCAYLYWDTLRLRRQKSELMNANMHQGLKIVLETLSPAEADELTSSWSVRDDEALQKIEEVLKTGHLSMDAVKAQTLVVIINDIERIDRMITASEMRRNVALRELERHRSVLARAMREATNVVEDADYVELDAAQPDIELRQLEATHSEAEEVEPEIISPESEADE